MNSSVSITYVGNQKLLKKVKCVKHTHKYCGQNVYTIKYQGPETSEHWLKSAKARLSQVQHKPSRKNTFAYKKQKRRIDAQIALFNEVATKTFRIYKYSTWSQINSTPGFATSAEVSAMRHANTLWFFYELVKTGKVGLDRPTH